MTTKQEIIEFINENKYSNIANNEANWLVQMIKDLKPTVKKLPWAKN